MNTKPILSDRGTIVVVGVEPPPDVKALFANRVTYFPADGIKKQGDFPDGTEIVLYGDLGKQRRGLVDCAQARKKVHTILGDQTSETLFGILDKLTAGVDLAVNVLLPEDNGHENGNGHDAIAVPDSPNIALSDPEPPSSVAPAVEPAEPSVPVLSADEQICAIIAEKGHFPVQNFSGEADRLLPTIHGKGFPTLSHARLTQLISRVDREPRPNQPATPPTPIIATMNPPAPANFPEPQALPATARAVDSIHAPQSEEVTLHKPQRGELKAFVLKYGNPNAPIIAHEGKRLLALAPIVAALDTTLASITQTLYELRNTNNARGTTPEQHDPVNQVSNSPPAVVDHSLTEEQFRTLQNFIEGQHQERKWLTLHHLDELTELQERQERQFDEILESLRAPKTDPR
jgi:hypothetical protein